MANLFEIGDNFAFDGTGSDNDSVVNMKIVNSQAATINIDLFHTIQAAVIVGAKQGQARADQAFLPYTASANGVADLDGFVYFDANGNQVYQDALGVKATVSLEMANFTYRDFFNVLGLAPKKVKKLRIGVSEQSQIQQGKITVVEFTDFGKNESDPINLSTFFSPNQFQNTIIDVPLILDLDRNKGLQMTILSGVTVTVDIFLA
jgi:hypothetical protein